VDSLEYSWFLSPYDPIPSEPWLDAGIGLATKYEQDNFIIRLDGETTLREQTGEIQRHLETDRSVEDAWANLAKMRSDPDDTYGVGCTELRNIPERGSIQPVVFPEEKPKRPRSKESSYHLIGTGQPYAPEFFIAEPQSNSGKMMFAAIGIQYKVNQPSKREW
jgi:hypothetical protein